MTRTEDILVQKRDGRLEKIDLDKIHRVIEWAAEGLDNVSVLYATKPSTNHAKKFIAYSLSIVWG